MHNDTPDLGLELLSAPLDAEETALVEREIRGFAAMGISLTPEAARDLIWPNWRFDRMARWIIAAGV
jgi:hypothetical protein